MYVFLFIEVPLREEAMAVSEIERQHKLATLDI
jgi:hypothetical protein